MNNDVLDLIATAGPRGTFASTATIAARLGISRRTVFRRLADARRRGLLLEVPRTRPNGSTTSTVRIALASVRIRPRACHTQKVVTTYPSDRGRRDKRSVAGNARRVVAVYAATYRRLNDGAYPPHRYRSRLGKATVAAFQRGASESKLIEVVTRFAEDRIDVRNLAAWVTPPATVPYEAPSRTPEERDRARRWAGSLAAMLRKGTAD